MFGIHINRFMRTNAFGYILNVRTMASCIGMSVALICGCVTSWQGNSQLDPELDQIRQFSLSSDICIKLNPLLELQVSSSINCLCFYEDGTARVSFEKTACRYPLIVGSHERERLVLYQTEGSVRIHKRDLAWIINRHVRKTECSQPAIKQDVPVEHEAAMMREYLSGLIVRTDFSWDLFSFPSWLSLDVIWREIQAKGEIINLEEVDKTVNGHLKLGNGR